MAAYTSFGTLLKLGDGASPETFTTIADVGDIKGPDFSADIEDVTTHSTSGAWREKIATLLSPGKLQLPLHFQPQAVTHSYTAGLLKDFANRTKRNFQIVLKDPGTTTWTFAAYVTSFKMQHPVAGIIKADVELTLTGPPTLS